MSIYVRRQHAARLGQGNKASLPDLGTIIYRLNDVSYRNTLKLSDDKMTSGYMVISANTSFSIPLPEGYTTSNRLAVILRGNAIAKVVLVDPVLGTSSFLLKGTSGTTKGDHPGVISWQSKVTSITVSVPVGYDQCLLEYFLFEIPDMTVESSWQKGSQILGVVSAS